MCRRLSASISKPLNPHVLCTQPAIGVYFIYLTCVGNLKDQTCHDNMYQNNSKCNSFAHLPSIQDLVLERASEYHPLASPLD